MSESKNIVFDGDAFAWRCAYFNQGDPTTAIQSVRKVLRKLGGGRPIVCLSDPSRRYFRHDLFAGYKQRKTPQERPEGLEAVRDALAREFPSRIVPSLEADDVCGVIATTLDGENVIVSDDKDLQTVPGLHFRPRKPDEGITKITPAMAARFHAMQTLTGDTGDCYPGCPSIGPKRAATLLANVADDAAALWRAVVVTFRAAGKTAGDALLQGRLARICQRGDYCHETKRVIPWMPPAGSEHDN